MLPTSASGIPLLHSTNDRTTIGADTNNPDEHSGVRRFDHLATADVHAFVIGSPRTIEQEITGLDRGERDVDRGAVLGSRVVGKADPYLCVGPHDQSGAVEA